MKKYLIVLLSLIIVLQSVILADAAVYNKDSRYTIDLPDKFQSAGDNKFSADDKSNFYISFDDNSEEKFCVADMSDKDIREYTAKLVAEGEAAFANLGMDAEMKIVSAEKIKHPNGMYAFFMILETACTDAGKTKTNYQKIYAFSGVENIITFTYTADKKEQLNDADTAFDSIVINEGQAESRFDKIKTAVFYVVIILVILLAVILFVKKRSK